MSFTASGAGLAFAAIGILVGFLAVAGLAYESGVDDHPGRIIIRDVCALYVIANVVVYSMTALPPRSESETRAATIAEISSHFGLESGKDIHSSWANVSLARLAICVSLARFSTLTVQAHGIRRRGFRLGSLPRMADPISLRFRQRK